MSASADPPEERIVVRAGVSELVDTTLLIAAEVFHDAGSSTVLSGTKQSVVLFHIRFMVENEDALLSFVVKKRYSQFRELYQMLRSIHSEAMSNIIAEFPDKKGFLHLLQNTVQRFWYEPDEAEFLEKRRVLLENFLNAILKNDKLKNSQIFEKWVRSDVEIQVIETEEEDEENGQDRFIITDVDIFECKETFDIEFVEPNVEHNNTRVVKEIHVCAIYDMDHVVFYEISCSGYHSNIWKVSRRYRQLFAMDQALKTYIRGLKTAETEITLKRFPQLPLRTPKLLTNHLDAKFQETRRVLIQNYLRKLNAIDEINGHDVFLSTLGAPGFI